MKFNHKSVAASFLALSAVTQTSLPVSSKLLQQFASEETAKKLTTIGQAQAQMMEMAPSDEVSWQRGGDKVSWKRG
jgi:hypothetical protein